MDYIKAVKLHRKLGHIGRELSGLRGMRPHGMARPTHFPEGEGHHRHPGPHHGPGHRGGILPRERILLILKNAPEEGLRQKDIASRMRINPSSLSEAIDKLEADRYVARDVDPEDRRSTRICLTEKGSARACEVEDMHKERLSALFANLSEEEQDQLLYLLDKAFPDPED
ncbi:MAG: MarR family transcriptional regulator [Solobacterium sp.]|nr:MarR family transcriptional regulator [Solobacterium sp.]